jgi:hypothetical protein
VHNEEVSNCTSHKHYWGHKIKDVDMQWTGGVWRREEKCKQGFDGKTEGETTWGIYA